ncbi:MAG: PAS domain-containing protein [Gorillibacterium sp.]|nr:PAS domain-containing protein [Gorillibacterium sp.]
MEIISQCRQYAVLLADNSGELVGVSSALSYALGYEEGADLIGSPIGVLFGVRGLFELERGQQSDKTVECEKNIENKIFKLLTRYGGSVESRVIRRQMDCWDQVGSLTLYIFPELEQNMELSLLQQFGAAFMTDINLGVLLIDLSLGLVDISDTACRILGFQRDEVVGKFVDQIFADVHPEHHFVNQSTLDGVVLRNHPISWMNKQERYELLLDSNVLKNSQGHKVGAYVMFKDVTNLRSLEEQVKRSDRLAMIGQISAGTAHEIRNPLTSIKGFLQILHHTFIEKGMVKEQSYTDIMLSEINRINDLVSEFLLLGKRKDIKYKEVEVHTTLSEILPIINNEAILHGVAMIYEPLENMPQVIADRELLKQVFLNISKNGIEAMTEGGSLTITEKVDYDERYVHVEVHDSGPGIPNFIIDKIFDPFFTTKSDGTGLGLSVCQRIVHDMGGAIKVSSKGFGTTFTICLPYT